MPLNVSSAFPDLGRDAPGGKAARAGKGKAAGKGGKAGDKPAAPAKPAASAAQKALQKMGLVRDIDLALHLPLRYEDETRITALRNAREGDTVQIEATVTHSEVQLRPRRMLKVTVDDGTAECVLTFFSFYPCLLYTSPSPRD